MNKYKFNRMLALASTMALIAGSHSVYAQQANDNTAGDQPQVEEVLVTGFKASLKNSIELKRNSDSIVEAISSEDIGKLPDKSIAESLMRLPGLATQRLNGRSQVISIRGMAPDFGTTLMNGRQQVSTGDSRSAEYDQYPAEFTSTALVYKTPDASIIGQGISGTVDIRTIRPLEYGREAIVINARYEQNEDEALNSDASNHGDKETISYVDQFMDDTLGIAVGLSHTDSPVQGERFNAWGYAPVATPDGELFVIGGVKPFVQSDTLVRDSLITTIEFQPNDGFYTALDIFYSEFEEEQLLRGIELPLQWGNAVLQPGYTVTNGIITSGTFTNVLGVIRSDATLTDATLFAAGWNTKFALGDYWEANVDISQSTAEREMQVIENYSGYIDGPDTVDFYTNSEGTRFNSSLDYTDASKIRITNLQSWGGTFVPASEGGQKGYYSTPSTDDELTQIRLSATRDLDSNFLSKIEFGVNSDTRSKSVTSEPEYYFALPNDATQAPLPSKTGLTDLSFIGFGSIISYDPLAPMKEGIYELVRAVRSDIADRTWEVDEDVITAFVKVGVDTSVLNIPVTGNVGVQYVTTDQSSVAMSSSGEAGTFVGVEQRGGDTYNNVLPSLNLNFAVFDNTNVRLGLARTLTRPRMDQMRASSTFTLSDNANQLEETTDINNSPWSATGGNPELRPWIADAADLSVEHYFDDGGGYVSLAGYYKDLDTYVYSRSTVKDFSEYPVPPEKDPQMFVGLQSLPINGNGGYMRGAEFSLTLNGDLFSEALSSVGVIFNASYNESNIAPEDTPQSVLPGLSRNVHGIQLFYEKNGFDARISQNYRSEFLGAMTSNVGARTERIIAETTLIDAQIGYTFDYGSLDGLGITLQAYNLNDEPFVTTEQGDENRVIDYQSYGRSYAVNVSYKF